MARLARADPFDGEGIDGAGTPDIARAGIAYVPESMAVFSDLTVQENMHPGGAHGPMDQARLDGSSASSRR